MIERTIFAIGFLAIVLPLEALASYVADQTIHWLAQAFIVAGSFFVNLFVLIVCFEHRFRLWIILGFAYLVLVSVYTAPLGVRWYSVDTEAKRIASWAYSEQMKTGSYPDNLREYSFLRPEYKEYIFYTARDYTEEGIESKAQSFEVMYMVGSLENTSHRYDSLHSQYGWQYHDD